MRMASLIRTAGLFLLALASPVLARGGMPEPLTPGGRTIEDMYFQIYVAGVLVFILVFVLLVVILWRFRERGGQGRATFERERGSHMLEFIWFAVPLLLVTWIGFIAYGGLLELDDTSSHEGYPGLDDIKGISGLDDQDFSSDHIGIGMVASQYNWQADYGNGVRVFSNPDAQNGSVSDANVFMVPAGPKVTFELTSTDVIHAFYIQDSNLAPVGAMVDANPGGPAQYNLLTIPSFTEGEYQVQCKEMCLNPGHAYMRARIKAVPLPEFQTWFDCQAAAAFQDDEGRWRRHGLVQDLVVDIGAGGVTSAGANETGQLTMVADGIVRVEATNSDATRRTVVAGGQELELAPGQTSCMAVPSDEVGALEVGSADGGDAVRIDLVDAEVVEVRLDEWSILIDTPSVEAGTTYLFRVTNEGGLPHNLFIGYFDAEQGKDVEAMSATIDGGTTTSFVWTPEQSVEFETWCDVPGHRASGMAGTLQVQ